MTILSEKLNTFFFHLDKLGDVKMRQLFTYASHQQQLSYNQKMEYLIGMLIIISKAVLQEFGENPQKIGIKSTDHIMDKSGFMVPNEVDAMLENFGILREMFEIFKNSHQAYRIIYTNYDRNADDPNRVRVIIDLLDKSRYFCGEMSEKFKVFERNY